MSVWQYDPQVDNRELEAVGLPPLVALVMGARGFVPDHAKEFIYGSPTHPAHLAPEMKPASKLIAEHQSPILIAGDYNADGICGTTILKFFLGEFTGREIYTYIHNREIGYGFNIEALVKAQEVGAGLIITVDCGNNNSDTVDFGKMMGFKIIVTDHHEPLDGRPDAEAVVDLKINQGLYGFDQLCGAAIAYKLT